MTDRMTIEFDADTTALRRELDSVSSLARSFGQTLTRSFDQAVFKGRDLTDVLRNLALNLSNTAFTAAMKPIERGISSFVTGLLGSALPFQKGGLVGGPVSRFASGGVVGQPTYFPMGQGRLGLMGEAGPEAILPLSRGPDGRLGVRAGSGGGGSGVTINMTVNTPDTAGFQRSQGRIASDLARAVERGRRNL
ncbi:MAG: phage tail tape measure protein [Pseudomonadota bacterium]